MTPSPITMPTGQVIAGCGWCGRLCAQLEGQTLQPHPRGDSAICGRCLEVERRRPAGVCALAWDCQEAPLITGRLCAKHQAAQEASGLPYLDWMEVEQAAHEKAQALAKKQRKAERYAAGHRTERQVTAEVLRALEKEPCVIKATRFQSGMYEVDGRKMKSGEDGIADFLVELRVVGWPLPVPMWLELKGTDGRQSDAQRRWQAFCVRDGRLYRLAHSADEAVAAVRDISARAAAWLERLRPARAA